MTQYPLQVEYVYCQMEHLFNNEFDVYRGISQKIGAGSFKQTQTKVYEGVRGRISTTSASDRQVYDRDKQNYEITHKIYCSPAYKFENGDIIHFRDLKLEVKDERDPSYSGHHKEVYCERAL